MRISDWSSDVCSSDFDAGCEAADIGDDPFRLAALLRHGDGVDAADLVERHADLEPVDHRVDCLFAHPPGDPQQRDLAFALHHADLLEDIEGVAAGDALQTQRVQRSEEHTSELQSLMRISYA